MTSVKATLLHIEEADTDLLRFFEKDPVDVELTDSEGTENLKRVFTRLLSLLIEDDVTIEYEKDPGFKNDMFDNVCKEYISALNGELAGVRHSIISEGLMKE